MSNLTTPIRHRAAVHAPRPKDTISMEARKSIGAVGNYVPREKDVNEALAPANDLWKRKEYRLGDGDHTTQVPRPGSLRAFALPSRGLAT
jgi:hypothetical protein